MRAVIQAGGKGTRLRNITGDRIPKPMAPIKGKPLLQWQIEELKGQGVREVFLITGHLGHVIREYFGDGNAFGITIRYIREEEPLGSGGALYRLKGYVEEKETLLFLYGDIFFHLDVGRMLKFHLEKKGLVTALAHPNSHPFDSDLLETDREGRILSILPKNQKRTGWQENIVNAAFYVIDAEIIMRMEREKPLDFEKDILQMQAECGKAYAYRSTEYVRDAGTEARLKSVEEDLTSGYIDRRCLKNRQKCIFLDRDGTVNKKDGFIFREEQFELLEDAAEAIRRINRSEYLAILVTNQPAVARGLCSVSDVEMIHRKMQTLLGREGVYLDDIAYCPHHPDRGYEGENTAYKIRCRCRKPATGMLEKMAERYNISLEDSWMIGDTTVDIMTGRNASMRTGLVLTGEAGRDGKYRVQPDICGKTLSELTGRIIRGT